MDIMIVIDSGVIMYLMEIITVIDSVVIGCNGDYDPYVYECPPTLSFEFILLPNILADLRLTADRDLIYSFHLNLFCYQIYWQI